MNNSLRVPHEYKARYAVQNGHPKISKGQVYKVVVCHASHAAVPLQCNRLIVIAHLNQTQVWSDRPHDCLEP